MAATRFPRAGRLRPGYDTDQVEAFLLEVALALTGPGEPRISPGRVRRAGFDLVLGGYAVAAVDAVLDQLELRVARRSAPGRGDRTAASVLARLGGEDGRRLRRAGPLTRGYHPGDVDRFADAVVATLKGQDGPGLAEVRSVVFRSRLGGYVEDLVDEVLDDVVEVLLAREAHGAPVR